MKPTDILDALDEFDARYLECYHQVPSRLLDWPNMNKLSSPLLGPESGSVASQDKESTANSVPRAHVAFEHSVTLTAMLLATASPTYLTLESENYRPVDSTNVQYHQPPTHGQFGQYFDQPLDDILFAPLDDPLLRSISDNVSENKETTLAHPLRMNRLLLTLTLTAKLNIRRSRDRRSTVTTYVGNPFYRRRNLQQAKRYEGPDAV